MCPTTNENFLYTLEDQEQTTKVWRETRIPSEQVQLIIKKKYVFTSRLLEEVGDHIGMIHVDNVNSFKYSFYTSAMTMTIRQFYILLGKTPQDNFIGRSTDVIRRFTNVYFLLSNRRGSNSYYIDYDGDMVSNKSTDYIPPSDNSVLEELQQVKRNECTLRKVNLKKDFKSQ